MKIAAVILAGGASSRMGAPKALLDWHGEAILHRLERIFARHVDQSVVVVGGEPRVVAACGSMVRNPHPERGMLSSLQCGLRVLNREIDAVMFLPVDYPAVEESTILELVAAFERNPAAAFAVPRLGARHGHPVLVARRMLPEMLRLAPSATPRDLIRSSRAQTVYVDVDDEGTLRDIDTPADYEALLRGRAFTEPAP